MLTAEKGTQYALPPWFFTGVSQHLPCLLRQSKQGTKRLLSKDAEYARGSPISNSPFE